jgi:voltage-dependent calcium channel L type alpha-1D
LVLKSAPIVKIKPSENPIRKLFFYVYDHRHFERFIQICILANTVVLMMEWYRMDKRVSDITEILNQVFTAIFAVEAMIRLLAIGLRHYIRDGWNIFDFLIAVGSIVGILVSMSTSV